jgi:hypothetical protein
MEIFQAAVLPVLDAEKETCARAEKRKSGRPRRFGDTPDVHPLKSSRRSRPCDPVIALGPHLTITGEELL